jgi:hypothetical protein
VSNIRSIRSSTISLIGVTLGSTFYSTLCFGKEGGKLITLRALLSISISIFTLIVIWE